MFKEQSSRSNQSMTALGKITPEVRNPKSVSEAYRSGGDDSAHIKKANNGERQVALRIPETLPAKIDNPEQIAFNLNQKEDSQETQRLDFIRNPVSGIDPICSQFAPVWKISVRMPLQAWLLEALIEKPDRETKQGGNGHGSQ